MMTSEISLNWIDELPNVDEGIKEQRDVLAHMLDVIERFQEDATSKRLSLENDVKARWTDEQIAKAIDTAKIIASQKEAMENTRARHEALAKEKGASKFQFIVMQDGVDFACHADFGNGWVPFYPEREATNL